MGKQSLGGVMPKIGLGIDVLTAAKQRISQTFDDFEKVYVSFSAGKDSTVMLHLVCEEARKRNRKIGVLLVDLEGQYKLTIEHALEMYELYSDVVEPYWCCLQISLRNAVSVYEPKWICWDDEKKKEWIRDMPEFALTDKEILAKYHNVGIKGEIKGEPKTKAQKRQKALEL